MAAPKLSKTGSENVPLLGDAWGRTIREDWEAMAFMVIERWFRHDDGEREPSSSRDDKDFDHLTSRDIN